VTYKLVDYRTGLAENLGTLSGPGLFLVTAGKDGRPNIMTIGWGTVGPIWSKPGFVVMVRPTRYTHQLLAESDSFTVCVPKPDMTAALDFCGTRSGRDHDKFATLGWQPEPSLTVSAPGIAGCPMIYECQIRLRNEVTPETLAPEVSKRSYGKGDFHTVYFGEILATRLWQAESAER
jgi:flavin reductase (DIM6/NTAB) family NADH-FMN oxidoreductase RutF